MTKSFALYTFLVGIILSFFGVLAGIAKGNLESPIVLIHLILSLFAFLLSIVTFFKNLSKVNNFFIYCKAFFLTFIVLVLLVLPYSFFAKKNILWDLTEEKIYSLSPQSKNVLTKVNQPLQLFVYDDYNSVTREYIRNLLSLYQAENNKITYQFVNPLEAKNVRKYFNPNEKNIIYFEYGDTQDPLIGQLKILNEAEITKAIFRITAGAPGKIYYAIGHGEPDGDDTGDAGFSEVTKALIEQNYEFRGLLINTAREIPQDCDLLILAAAKKEYLSEERVSIKDYLANGGKIMILNDPEQNNDFSFLLDNYGIKFSKSVVLDQVHVLHGAPEVGWQLLLRSYSEHPITNKLSQQKLPVVFLLANALEYVAEDEKFQPLIFSSKASWGETDLKNLFSSKPNAAYSKEVDQAGPLTVAGVYQADLGQKLTYGQQQKIAIFSDIEWLRNVNIGIYANRELFVNTVNWLVDDGQELEIAQRMIRPSRLEPIQKSDYQTLFIVAFTIPELFLILLVTIWYRRKHRRC